jgi:hypothetical protein
MLRFLLSVLVLGAVALGQDNPPASTLKPGSDIPGPFHAYNVTGKKKDTYHCLVSEFGLNPVVMVVVRGVEDKDSGLRELLIKLDNLIDKNPDTRLASFAVFVSNTLKDVARENDQREKLSKKIDDLFKAGSGLKHVVLALDAPSKLAKWPLEEKADVVVILYNQYRVVSVHNLTWEQLKQEKDMLSPTAKQILNEVRQKFGAKRG